jgi:hypothetical protein
VRHQNCLLVLPVNKLIIMTTPPLWRSQPFVWLPTVRGTAPLPHYIFSIRGVVRTRLTLERQAYCVCVSRLLCSETGHCELWQKFTGLSKEYTASTFRVPSRILKIHGALSSETSVSFYQTAGRRITGNRILRSQFFKKLALVFLQTSLKTKINLNYI